MKILAVLFDLDGTLTEPFLDFELIRAEIGIPAGPILEALETLPAEPRARALEILHRHEDQAAAAAVLHPGAADLLSWLRGRGLPVGLVTRNRRECVERVCRTHHLRFDAIITREDGPYKPDPFPITQSCLHLGVRPAHTLMVGDFLLDLQCARAAGAISILLNSHPGHAAYSAQADYVISALLELPKIIEEIEFSPEG